MESAIRKEAQDVSSAQSDSGVGEVRRSRRAPQPTTQYLKGMEQLRKDVKVKDAQRQSQRSNKRCQLQTTSFESIVQQSEVNGQQEWISCILPGDEPRMLNVQVVLQTSNVKGSQKLCSNNGRQSHPTYDKELLEDNLPKGAPIKKVKLNNPLNDKHSLLGILYSIAFKVATEYDSECKNEEVSMEKPSMLQLSPTLTIPTPRKFHAILEEKKTSSPYQEWREIPKRQLETNHLKENVMAEKNNSNESLTTPQCSEKEFFQLQDRFSECKRNLLMVNHQ